MNAAAQDISEASDGTEYERLTRRFQELEAQECTLAGQEAGLLEQRRSYERALKTLFMQICDLEDNVDSIKARLRVLNTEEDAMRTQRRENRAEREHLRGAFFQLQGGGNEKDVRSLVLIGQQEEVPPELAEQREHPRIPATVDVTFRSEHNFFTGLTENISEGGVFIATYDDIPLGTELDMTVNLPFREPFQVHGVVRWVRNYNEFTEHLHPGIGVQFADLSDEHSTMINDFLKQRAPLLYA